MPRRLLPLLAAALLTACGTTPEPAPSVPSAPPEPAPATHYVALGDSYAAMGSRSAPTSGPEHCYRSADNYPSLLLADPLIPAGEDASCSSAVTADIPAQAAALTPDTDLVTLSIGGNDIRFGDIAGCFLRALNEPVDCPALLDVPVHELLTALPAELDGVYDLIGQRSPGARVIATGYLPLVSAGECPELATVPEEQRAWAVDVTAEINTVVREAAERHGAEFVLPAEAGSHSVCAEPEQRWTDVTGELTDAYPMHPTPAGQQAMAEAVRAVL
ncbi:SGNH/GDSL hydrolase family protein [Corynebacterium sp.]|uniref:SGNH/GDSL hydrolase family protein n=1 Tax=Corynebacterium sp. TaxID=1720 RepID=UPI0019B0B3B4|nr:SGNH/GDSL hydrolase family protein [Corynebacterium sp.]HHU67693.1 SGNH/GDSL hydrolase family protein [Corynebacterium sp.]